MVFHYSCECKYRDRHFRAFMNCLGCVCCFLGGRGVFIYLFLMNLFPFCNIFWIGILCHYVLKISSSMCVLSVKCVHRSFSLSNLFFFFFFYGFCFWSHKMLALIFRSLITSELNVRFWWLLSLIHTIWEIFLPFLGDSSRGGCQPQP